MRRVNLKKSSNTDKIGQEPVTNFVNAGTGNLQLRVYISAPEAVPVLRSRNKIMWLRLWVKILMRLRLLPYNVVCQL
jgi:hypothetical protein